MIPSRPYPLVALALLACSLGAVFVWAPWKKDAPPEPAAAPTAPPAEPPAEPPTTRGVLVRPAEPKPLAPAATAVGEPRLVVDTGHPSGPHTAAFDSTGKLVISTGNNDHSARVWDAATGRELFQLREHAGNVISAAFSPDGQRAITTGSDHTSRIWNLATGQEILVLKGHTDRVWAAAFSPNQKQLITASGDKTARIWDAMTGKEIHQLRGHAGDVYSASFSPDGKQVLTSGWDATARVWSVETGKELFQLKGHADVVVLPSRGVLSAVWSHNGTRIVTAGADKTARVWDAANGKELRLFEGHTGVVTSAAISPNGKRLVTTSSHKVSSGDETARVWDAVTGKELLQLKHTGGVQSASFSSDGRRAITCDQTGAHIWDTESWQEVSRFAKRVAPTRHAVFSRYGTRVFAVVGGSSWEWNLENGQVATRRLNEFYVYQGISINANGDKFVTDGGLSQTAEIWNFKTGKRLHQVFVPGARINSAIHSPDGKWIVLGDSQGARIVNAETGEQTQVFQVKPNGFKISVTVANFSPDGKWFVGGYGDTARVWDIEGVKEILQLPGHTGSIGAVTFSPDQKRIATGDETMVHVWDSKTGKELYKVDAKIAATAFYKGVRCVGWSADGKRGPQPASSNPRWSGMPRRGRNFSASMVTSGTFIRWSSVRMANGS